MEAGNSVVLPSIVLLGKVFAQVRKRLHCSRNKERVVQLSYCSALLHLSHSHIMEVKIDPIWRFSSSKQPRKKKGESP